MKRELIESCPDLPEHLVHAEHAEEDQDQDEEGFPRVEELGCEKEDAAKEEIKKILSKVDERKRSGRRRVEKKKSKEYDGKEWNNDDTTECSADPGGGKKSSHHLFRCPHADCGATFAKEVFQFNQILK